MTKKAAIKNIREKDEELSLLVDGWKATTKAKTKERFFRMIEKGLDERKVLMDVRDGVKPAKEINTNG